MRRDGRGRLAAGAPRRIGRHRPQLGRSRPLVLAQGDDPLEPPLFPPGGPIPPDPPWGGPSPPTPLAGRSPPGLALSIPYCGRSQLTLQGNSHKLNSAPCPRAFRRDRVV